MNLHLPLLLRGGHTQGIVLFLEMVLGTQQKHYFLLRFVVQPRDDDQ